MRISDWSSDVCSSDLLIVQFATERGGAGATEVDAVAADRLDEALFQWRAIVEEDAIQRFARAVDGLQMLQRHAKHGLRHGTRVAGNTLAVHLAVAGKQKSAVDEDGGPVPETITWTSRHGSKG